MSAGITETPANGLSDFSVEREVTADAVVVRVHGELDHSTMTCLEDQLQAAETGFTSAAVVVLDLTDVSYLGSDGLGLLLAIHRRCAMHGRRFRIVATTRAVLRPVALSGLDDVLSIAVTVDDAIDVS